MNKVTFTAPVWRTRNNDYILKKKSVDLTEEEAKRLLSQLENICVSVKIKGEIWEIPLVKASDSCQKLKKQLQKKGTENQIFQEAKVLQEEYYSWKKQRQKIEAEESSLRSRAYYERMKDAEQSYRESIGRYMPLFEELKPDLACFAGCTQESLYEELSVSIENKQRHLKSIVLRNRQLFDDLKDLRICAYTQILGEAFLDTEGKMDTDDGLPDKVSDFVKDLLRLLLKIEASDNKSQYADELERLWSKNKQKALQAQRFFKEEKDEALERPKDESLKEAKVYQTEAEKIRKYICSREKDWSYVRLLQMALPLIEEIAEQEEEREAGWYKKMAEGLYQLLLDFNKESDKARFCWVACDDRLCEESESIRVDFIAGEARWPGLYLYYAGEEKEMICIAPGSAYAV